MDFVIFRWSQWPTDTEGWLGMVLSMAVFINFLLNFKVQCRLSAAGLGLSSGLSWVSPIALHPPVSSRPSSLGLQFT